MKKGYATVPEITMAFFVSVANIYVKEIGYPLGF